MSLLTRLMQAVAGHALSMTFDNTTSAFKLTYVCFTAGTFAESQRNVALQILRQSSRADTHTSVRVERAPLPDWLERHSPPAHSADLGLHPLQGRGVGVAGVFPHAHGARRRYSRVGGRAHLT